MDFLNLFFDVNLYSILIPITFGLFVRKKFTFSIKIVWYFVILNFVFSLISSIPVKSWFGLESNNFIFYIVALSNIIFKYFIFKNLIRLKLIIKPVAIGLALLIISSLIFIGYINSTMTFSIITEAGFSICVCFLFLTNLHKDYQGDSLRKESMFWISIAFLFSGIFNILLHSFINSLYEYSPELVRTIVTFFSPLTETFVNLLITIGFYFARKNISNQ